ncbi:amino acid ABC transporter permease [Microbacterium saperdae]
MNLPDVIIAIAAGIPLTVLVACCAFVVGAVLALPLAFALRSPRRLVSWPVRALVDLLRSVPILVWLFILYFGVSIDRFHFDPLPAAVLALGVVAASYLAEVYRTALESVAAGQDEAARSLGLSRVDRFRFVVAPQAFRVALPSISTFSLTLLKDSSIPSVIGVTEIAFQTTAISRTAGSGLTGYVVAVALYLLLSLPVAFVARRADRQLRAQVSA